MGSLASLEDCKLDNKALSDTLSILLEPSPTLTLVAERLREQPTPLKQCQTYTDLIDIVFDVIAVMDSDAKADFIAGHPRIGETKNLSNLSAKEQATKPTPPEVLERLAQLNILYERRYPKLRYITFVSGRSRLQIADELETKLARAPNPIEVYSPEWQAELMRALNDVKLIAKSRLKVFTLE
jgi:2-oxo-4-hydroxy-4-carboxy--5-ureidoimidazoline (OHCU) decarboxylase